MALFGRFPQVVEQIPGIPICVQTIIQAFLKSSTRLPLR